MMVKAMFNKAKRKKSAKLEWGAYIYIASFH